MKGLVAPFRVMWDVFHQSIVFCFRVERKERARLKNVKFQGKSMEKVDVRGFLYLSYSFSNTLTVRP